MMLECVTSQWMGTSLRPQPQEHSKKVYNAGETLFIVIYKMKIYLPEKD